jgi:multiple sugar transport system permease protein
MALVLNENFLGRGIIRTILILPWGVPAVVEAQMWKFIYNDRYGAINDILYRLGIIHEYKAWLAKPDTAIMALITAEAWATSIFVGLILLGGLQSIPEDLYEAAKVDGAGRMKRFIYITLPLLKYAFVVALTFRTIQAFFAFDAIYVMTGGGPGGSTRVLSIYAYDTYFKYLNFGYGSCIAVVHFILGFILALLYLRMMKIRSFNNSFCCYTFSFIYFIPYSLGLSFFFKDKKCYFFHTNRMDTKPYYTCILSRSFHI